MARASRARSTTSKRASRGGRAPKIRVGGGTLRAIVFDPQRQIRRRFEWTGAMQCELNDPIFGDERLSFDDVLRRDGRGGGAGDLDLDKPIELGPWGGSPPPDGDSDLLGGGPIELTPGGPRQPSPPPRPPPEPPPAPAPEPPIKLDPWQHLPPLSPWPWDKPFDLPRPDPDEENFELYLRDPCDYWNLFGPFGPFAFDAKIELLFPKVPWLGPWQKPIEDGLAEALREFFKQLGKAADEGAIHGKDWENAGKKAGAAAAKTLWDWLWERLQERWFGGKLNAKSFCEFAEDRPWLTGLGIFVGLSGYGLYLGDEYQRKGKLKIDFGDVQFEYDGETGDWSFGLRFKFKF